MIAALNRPAHAVVHDRTPQAAQTGPLTPNCAHTNLYPPYGDRCCYLPEGFGIKIGAMDINRFTEKAQEAIRSAQSKAVRYGQQQIDVEHLLAALFEQENGLAPSILNKA